MCSIEENTFLLKKTNLFMNLKQVDLNDILDEK